MSKTEEASTVLGACLTFLGILVGSVAILFMQLQSMANHPDISGPTANYTKILSALSFSTGIVALLAFLTMIEVLSTVWILRIAFMLLILANGVLTPFLIFMSA